MQSSRSFSDPSLGIQQDSCLEDYQWLSSDAAHGLFISLLEIARSPAHNSALPPLQMAGDAKTRSRRLELLRTQVAFQKSCAEKFPNPENWFWTRKLLEQSSDLWCALETAADIPAEMPVLDLCSGAGADAIGIALAGHDVDSYDIEPVAQLLLDGNAHRNGVSVRSHCQPAETAPVTSEHFLHIDPDRRSGGARVTASHDFLPSWEVIEPMLDIACGASIKVAPATRLTPEMPMPDIVRYLSRNRSVRQQRWLWNQRRWPENSLVVSAYHQQVWNHEIFDRQSLDESDARDCSIDLLSNFIGDYDPVIRAADIAADFSQRLGVGILGTNGYLTSDNPPVHPMVRWFRVLETLAMDRKKLIAFSRSVSVRSWELKTRGVEFSLDPLRKALVTTPETSRELTILFTKVGKRNVAIVAEECKPQAGETLI